MRLYLFYAAAPGPIRAGKHVHSASRSALDSSSAFISSSTSSFRLTVYRQSCAIRSKQESRERQTSKVVIYALRRIGFLFTQGNRKDLLCRKVVL